MQVESTEALPDSIELVHALDVDLLEVVDRRRGHLWERDFVLTPTALVSEDWVVEVSWRGQTFAVTVTPPEVQSAGFLRREGPATESAQTLANPSRRGGRPTSVVPEGTPPQASDPSVWDTSRGRRRVAGGWAETAHLDPWWPEVVPELFEYSALAEDPTYGIRMEVGLTPHTIYVGQQLTLLSTVSAPPGQIPGRPWYWAPDPSGFTRINVGAAVRPTARQGALDQSSTFQTAYFASAPGQWAFPTGGVFYGGSESLVGPPTTVTVLPVPEAGSPEGYEGAVGRFKIQAWLEPAVLSWGEPALLRVEILGVGDVRSIPAPPTPLVSGGQVAPYRDFAWVETRDGVVGGLRVLEYLVTVVEAGPARVEPIVFSFFDPYVGDFGVAATEEMTLEVGN